MGVGTSTPNGMLHLFNPNLSGNDKVIIVEGGNGVVFEVRANGHLYAREVQVRLGTFPDYVFEDGYSLMPLDSVEAYIDQNKHLPNIPSASSVLNNGIGVGELQVKMMEKIEELYLYGIEQHRQNKTLMEENQALKEEIYRLQTQVAEQEKLNAQNAADIQKLWEKIETR